MDKALYDVIRDDYRAAIKTAQDVVLMRLADDGIVVGALVKSNWNQRVYRVTRIDFKASIGFLYGHQLRKDGTFGDSIHSIGTPESVEVTNG